MLKVSFPNRESRFRKRISFLGLESEYRKLDSVSVIRIFLNNFCLSQKAPNIIAIPANPWRCSGFTTRGEYRIKLLPLISFHSVIRNIESPKLQSNDLELNTSYQ